MATFFFTCLVSISYSFAAEVDNDVLVRAYQQDPKIHVVRNRLISQGYRAQKTETVDIGRRVCGISGCSFSYLLVERFEPKARKPGVQGQTILAVADGISVPWRVTSIRQVRFEPVSQAITTPDK